MTDSVFPKAVTKCVPSIDVFNDVGSPHRCKNYLTKAHHIRLNDSRSRLTIKHLIVTIVGILATSCMGYSQIEYVGDQTIVGDLNVGVTGTTGKISVTGDIGNLAAPGLIVTGDGGVVFSGSHGLGTIPATGAGSRLMWYPKKSAFRVGVVSGSQWDDANIGNSSFAAGYNSIASGASAVAMGGGRSLGPFSVAIGAYPYIDAPAVASGTCGISIGAFSNAIGFLSIAMMGQAMGDGAIAIRGHASGIGSVAIRGGSSVGENSISMGSSALATGYESIAIGANTTSVSSNCVTFGRFNVIEGSTDAWVESEPLFVIGNGTGAPNDPGNIRNRNAFIVRKNGDVELSAKVKMPRQGDILMGEFGE